MKNTLKCERDYTMDSPWENVWVKLSLAKSKVLRVGAFYRPDVSCTESLEHLETLLHHVSTQVASNVILGGDFNFPGIVWSAPEPDVDDNKYPKVSAIMNYTITS